MSATLEARLQQSERQREVMAAGSAAYRLRAIKLTCMVLLGICFWFSVPYYLPLKVDPDPKIAAANEAAAYEGNVTRQAAMPVIALIALYMWWRLPRRGRFPTRYMWITLAYLGWVAASLFWAESPDVTGKRLFVFAIDAFLALTIATRFSVRELAAFGGMATTTVVFISLYVDALQEKIFAPGNPDYRFTGVMTANYQAMNLVVSMVCLMTLARLRPRWLRWIAPIIVLELALLFLTRSRLGAIICIVMLSIMALKMARQHLRAEARALLTVAIAAVVLPALIYTVGRKGADAAQSAFMMGRTDTENTSNLSNRAPLWGELWESVETRPIAGFGWAGFWTPARVQRVSADQGWMVPNAHNTYLEQVLSVGLVGSFLYTLMLVGGAVIAWRRNRVEQTAESLMPAILLTWLALTSLAEAVVLDPYLPTLLAYSCIARMAMQQGSEAASDEGTDTGAIINGGRLPFAAQRLAG
jgi:O-antigen ligase